MKYLRANFLPQQGEAKKQGLIVGYQVMLSTPSSSDDGDVAIAAKHYKTMDEQKQREMGAKRFEMRDYKYTRYLREVTLKPVQ